MNTALSTRRPVRALGALVIAGALAAGLGACNKDGSGMPGGIGGGAAGGAGAGAGDSKGSAAYCDALKKVESVAKGTTDPQQILLQSAQYIPEIISNAPASVQQDWSKLASGLQTSMMSQTRPDESLKSLSNKMYTEAKNTCGVDLPVLQQVANL